MMSTESWILNHSDVSKVECLTSNYFKIDRKNKASTIIVTISKKRVSEDIVRGVLRTDIPVEFICNSWKDAFYEGEALRAAENARVAIGDGSDLFSALGQDDVWSFKPSEIRFIERSLRQHSRISDFYRLDYRRYRITRDPLPEAIIIFLNEYEVTSDAVRAAFDRYGQFDAIARTNPNGGITADGRAAAADLGIPIWTWAEFLGNLNRTWK